MTANRENITRVTREEARQQKDETDYTRLDAMTDDEIARAVADDAPLDVDWNKARLVFPPGKDVVTMRVDSDVLDWFRAQGKGYQTRINLALRVFYEASTRRDQAQGEVVASAKKPTAAKVASAMKKRRAAKPGTKATPTAKRRA
jgi:uncharacterized protein (DUF4415 family)